MSSGLYLGSYTETVNTCGSIKARKKLGACIVHYSYYRDRDDLIFCDPIASFCGLLSLFHTVSNSLSVIS